MVLRYHSGYTPQLQPDRYIFVGLILQEQHVIVDHDCRGWLITRPEGNPTIERYHQLKVYAVFKRKLLSAKQGRDRQVRQSGDNCPLIYALKGKEGLFTDISSIKRLNHSFRIILNHIVQKEPAGYQLVISVPSAHNISHILGKRFAQRFDALHYSDTLRKVTVEDAFRLLDRTDISIEDTRKLEFRIKKQAKEVGFSGCFSLKGIPPKFRDVLPPLALNNIPVLNFRPSRILITDDLIASGTTLNTAADLLSRLYPQAVIHAACLFSSAGR